MIQKFEVMLLSRKPFTDPDKFARRLFEDLKGCTVLHAIANGEEEQQRALVVGMQINGINEEHTSGQLTGHASALRIVCERAGVAITGIWRFKTNGLLDEVSRHLGR